MILVVFGTTGELIKLAPALTPATTSAATRTSPRRTASKSSRSHPSSSNSSYPLPDLWLGRGAAGAICAPTRMCRAGWRRSHTLCPPRARSASWASNRPGKPLVLVHGDTMTTVLGASMGRMLRAGVAHIEGGLRSYDWRNPFPEELNRRAASKLARIHYAPGSWAASNLKGGTIVDTARTPSATASSSSRRLPPPARRADVPFGLVSIHRYELLDDRGTARPRPLTSSSSRPAATPLLFVDHPVTAAAIRKYGFEGSGALRPRSPASASSRSSPSSAERVPLHRLRGKPGGVLLPRPSRLVHR